MNAFENIAFLACAVNLVSYFTGVTHMDISEAANTVTNYMGTAFLLTLFGGFISDSYVNRFKSCVIFSFLELVVSIVIPLFILY